MKKICFLLILMILCHCEVNASSLHSTKSTMAHVTIEVSDINEAKKIQVYTVGRVLGAYGAERESVDYFLNLVDYTNIKPQQFKGEWKNGVIKFDIPITEIRNAEISIQGTSDYYHFPFIMPLYPGDDIKMVQKERQWSFSGIGATRAECSYNLNYLLRSNNLWSWTDKIKPSTIVKAFNKVDSVGLAALTLLEKYRDKLSDNDYTLMKLKGILYCEGVKYDFFERHGGSFGLLTVSPESDDYAEALHGYVNPIWNSSVFEEFRKKNIAGHCLEYLEFLASNGYTSAYCFSQSKQFKIEDCYNFYVKQYSGSVREWLIYRLLYLHSRRANFGNVNYCVDNALNAGYIQNKSILNYIRYMKESGLPGAVAYDFALPDTSGKIVRLSDFKGKVVCLDFYFGHCPACAWAHQAMDKVRMKLQGKNFVIVGIFWDTENTSRKAWLKLIHDNKYTGPETINLLAKRSANGKDSEIINRMGSQRMGGGLLVFIDKYGKYLPFPPVAPVADDGKATVKFIEENL